MQESKAKELILKGVIAAFISSLVTLWFALDGGTTEEPNLVGILEAVLIFFLGIGIYNKSRFCAVAILIFYLITQVSLVYEVGIERPPYQWFIAALFVYAYVSAIGGTFSYHKILEEEGRKMPAYPWIIFGLVPSALEAILLFSAYVPVPVVSLEAIEESAFKVNKPETASVSNEAGYFSETDYSKIKIDRWVLENHQNGKNAVFYAYNGSNQPVRALLVSIARSSDGESRQFVAFHNFKVGSTYSLAPGVLPTQTGLYKIDIGYFIGKNDEATARLLRAFDVGVK